MHFSDADIAHLGKLTRLTHTPEQRAAFAEQLSRILDYLDQITQSDVQAVDGVQREPMTPYEFRDDVAKPSDAPHLLAQAPRREGNFVVSPPTA